MIWSSFTVVFALTMVGLTLALGGWRRLLNTSTVKTVTFALVVGYLFDYIANERDFWEFPRLVGVFFWQNPVENSVLMVGVGLLVLNLNLLAMQIFSDRSQQGHRSRGRPQQGAQ